MTIDAESEVSMSELTPPSPVAYKNWIAYERMASPRMGGEIPLFTDAHITGQIEKGIGPYQLLNTVRGPSRQAPAIVLRYWLCLDPGERPVMEKTDTGAYHGGGLSEELASLISLCMGIRMKPGGENRMFGVEWANGALGRPLQLGSKDPMVPAPSVLAVLPQSAGERCLNVECGLLPTFPKLSPEAAVALIRSARSYQEALWVVEADAALAWLLLVSSVETAANFWKEGSAPALEILNGEYPRIASLVEENPNDQSLKKEGNKLAKTLKATAKFVDFMLTFLPDPPSERQPELTRMQHAWDEPSLQKTLRTIYRWRSEALHAGTPFPYPMCVTPDRIGRVLSEIPIAAASAAMGGVWLAEDVPMHFWLFEHLVRGALKKWWASLVGNAIPANVGLT